MYKTTVKIDGMMCDMCESHINDALRNVLPIKKVKSSHKSGETVMISEGPLTLSDIENALADSGYKATGLVCVPYEKKGLFGRKTY